MILPLRSIFPRCLPLLLFLLGVAPLVAQSRYFGRNKPRYESFDFRVLNTPHFRVHFYPSEEAAARQAARMAERWYKRLSTFFEHNFIDKRPLILYADQGDFQQTNTTPEEIGEGTGGFTESLKDRIVLPLTGSIAADDHVIGHELVHAFQYDIAGRSAGRDGLQQMYAMPLWFIEGMAEYVSIGRNDPNTAQWLRDNVLRNELPSLDDLGSNRRYFPYRYGQAVWAYIAGRWGNNYVPKVFKMALRVGWREAVQRVLSVSSDSLSSMWQASVRSAYGAEVAARTAPSSLGRSLIRSSDERDQFAIAPSISPDGRKAIILSSRDLFATSYYLVDVASGRLEKKLLDGDGIGHLDALRFISTAGTWSPDGRRFAFVAYEEGDDRLVMMNPATGSIEETIAVPGIGQIANPAWSPDGTTLAFSGGSGGISDLWLLSLRDRKLRRLTNDRYADLHPAWSPDGKTIAIASDRSTSLSELQGAQTRIAFVDVESGEVTTPVPTFGLGKQINPQFSPDGRSLYFVADPDGVSDLYRWRIGSAETERLTRVATGVSGITETSPTMSVASRTGTLVLSVFDRASMTVRVLAPDSLVDQTLPTVEDGLPAPLGLLPPGGAAGPVEAALDDPLTGLMSDSGWSVTPYSAALSLDYFGPPTIGAAVTGNGTTFGGSTQLWLSDLLGYHQLGIAAQLYGDLANIGGEVFYEYTKNRLGWGAGVAYYPSSFTQNFISTATVNDNGVVRPATILTEETQRTTYAAVQLLGTYPFSTTMRAELQAGYARQWSTGSVIEQTVVNGDLFSERSFDVDLGTVNLLSSSVALVGDRSAFGFTSPVRGWRWRGEVGGTIGTYRFGTLLLDYRNYIFLRPFTIAMRAMHYGRYGTDADSLAPLFLGYESFVRGYRTFERSECSSGNCPEVNRLFGSKLAIAGLEFRAPLFGNEEFGLINFPYLPTEIALFLDGGTAWDNSQTPRLAFDAAATDRVPVFSIGASARVNLFGVAVVEVFAARPLQRPNAPIQWGFQLAPGW